MFSYFGKGFKKSCKITEEMYIPKKYGQSKVDRCPFCSEQATTINSQKVPVCMRHKESILNEMKCACGSYAEMKSGKFGIYFSCLKCGNINLKKVLELNEVEDMNKPKNEFRRTPQSRTPKEITIRSDDPDYF